MTVRAGSDPAAGDLASLQVLVTAGGTREPIDPVRFIGNRSSGKQGYALARTALARGARVVLVAANVTLPTPDGARLISVETADELRGAVMAESANADVIVMAAAVADFRPVTYHSSKIKKEGAVEPQPIELTRNPDILAEISAHRHRKHQCVAGFAAETDDVLANGAAKLARKGCDLLVANEVGMEKNFGEDENEAVILSAVGAPVPVTRCSKDRLADEIWDVVLRDRRAVAGTGVPRPEEA